LNIVINGSGKLQKSPFCLKVQLRQLFEIAKRRDKPMANSRHVNNAWLVEAPAGGRGMRHAKNSAHFLPFHRPQLNGWISAI
jgi:hypothetical protein